MRNRGHENTRHSGGIGNSPTDCRPVVHGGHHVGGCGALRGRVDFFGQALEARLEARRRCRAGSQATIRFPMSVIRRAERPARRDSVARSLGGRILHRLVDLCPRGAGDPQEVRRYVPCRPCWPAVARLGFHAAKATTQGARARRSGHPAMAQKGLAADQKGGTRRKASIVFLDETGFLLQPLNRRTWAPRGQRPEQRAWQRHDRLSVIASLHVSPRRRLGHYFRVHSHNVRTAEVMDYLRDLHRQLGRALIVVMDRLPAHRVASAACISKATWLSVEWLPWLRPRLESRRSPLELLEVRTAGELPSQRYGRVARRPDRSRWRRGIGSSPDALVLSIRPFTFVVNP